jgi:hypothetical protein
MTAGIAGKLSRVRMPWPWTGAEKDEGIVGTPVAVVVVAVVEVATAEEGLLVGKFTLMRRLERATPTLMPPTLTPRRGEAVTPATRRKRGVVNCIVKIQGD